MTELPEPPLRVLAKPLHPGYADTDTPLWWTPENGTLFWCDDSQVYCPAALAEVIPHPMNDAAAIQIIESARPSPSS